MALSRSRLDTQFVYRVRQLAENTGQTRMIGLESDGGVLQFCLDRMDLSRLISKQFLDIVPYFRPPLTTTRAGAGGRPDRDRR